MAENVTELSLRWKRDPDAANTIALANAVRGSLYASLIQEVGAFAADRLSSEVPVLVAVARMYVSAQRLADAQTLLVSAGKVAPRDAQIYRLLGEVLLRRGDAERAEKVLERAMQLGATDADTRLWLDRSRVFKSMQAKAGAKAVAAEVERAAPAATADTAPSDDDPPSERTIRISEKNEIKKSSTKAQSVAERLGSSDLIDEEPPTSVRLTPPPPAPAPMPPSSRRPPPVAPPPVVTGENRAGAAGIASSLTPGGMPKAQPAFLFDKDLSGGNPVEDSVTFDLARHDLARPAMPSLGEPLLDPGQVVSPPKPRELLDALALAGVFETSSNPNAKVEWAKPAKETRRRGAWLLGVAMILFVGGAGATYRYVEQQRTLKRAAAERVMVEIETGLLDGRPGKIADLEKAFARAFELDSRSQRAAIAWARERALVGLVRGGQDVSFEDATARVKSLETKPQYPELAFTQLASFLFQNDTAGAVSLLPRHDKDSSNDPWYQLLAGTCLERLGDARAAERFGAAVKLSPEFVPAQIALIRHEIFEGERARATELVGQFRARHGERPEAIALAALLWVRDPSKPKAPPELVGLAPSGDGLPLALASVPHAVAARLALEKGTLPEAREAIRKGLAAADGPAVASWFGFLALEAEDEALARKAALAAVAYSALYPRARSLAARVALLGGRLDETLKATEELDPSMIDVALARAIVAYERVDASALLGAIEALPAEKRSASQMASATLAGQALLGRFDVPPSKIVARAGSDELWSDIVAMDIALDTGNLDAASAIGNRWLAQTPSDKLPALRALRLARLARYQSRLDDAEVLSLAALNGATPTLRSVIERAFVLAAREKSAEIGPMLAKHAAASGPVSSWLGAFATASAGKVDDARGRSSSLEAPPDSAPVPFRVAIAASLGAMRDRKRGTPVVESLVAQGVRSPDVVAAAQSLGVKVPGVPAAPAPPPRR